MYPTGNVHSLQCNAASAEMVEETGQPSKTNRLHSRMNDRGECGGPAEERETTMHWQGLQCAVKGSGGRGAPDLHAGA